MGIKLRQVRSENKKKHTIDQDVCVKIIKSRGLIEKWEQRWQKGNTVWMGVGNGCENHISEVERYLNNIQKTNGYLKFSRSIRKL